MDDINLCKKVFYFLSNKRSLDTILPHDSPFPIPKQTSHRAQTIRRLFSLIEYTHDHFYGSR